MALVLRPPGGRWTVLGLELAALPAPGSRVLVAEARDDPDPPPRWRSVYGVFPPSSICRRCG